MVAPKGPGHAVRSHYKKRAADCRALWRWAQDATSHAHDLALAWATGIGCGREGGIMETTFARECVTDLFGEQAVLCGGLVSRLMKAGVETLIEAGYPPEMAYFECVHEVKLIVDLVYEKGLAGMRYSISNTAEYGDYTRGKRVITDETRESMKKILGEIQSGEFAREWIAENNAGQENFLRMRSEQADTQIETRGQGAAQQDGLDRLGVLRWPRTRPSRRVPPAGSRGPGARPGPPGPPAPPDAAPRPRAITAAGPARRSMGAARPAGPRQRARPSWASACRSPASACC